MEPDLQDSTAPSRLPSQQPSLKPHSRSHRKLWTGQTANSPRGSTNNSRPTASPNSKTLSAKIRCCDSGLPHSFDSVIRVDTPSAKSGSGVACPAPVAQISADSSCRPSHRTRQTTSTSTCTSSAADSASPTSAISRNSPPDRNCSRNAVNDSSNPPPGSCGLRNPQRRDRTQAARRTASHAPTPRDFFWLLQATASGCFRNTAYIVSLVGRQSINCCRATTKPAS